VFHRRIAVDGRNQNIPPFFRIRKIADMSDVDEIEAAVDQNNGSPFVFFAVNDGLEFGKGKNFF
jgi:hypothetical protein